MKNFIVILSVILLLVGTSGITVIAHLCQGNKVQTQLYDTGSKLCCSQSVTATCHKEKDITTSPECHTTKNCSNEHNNKNKDCCEDVVTTFKLNELFSLKYNPLLKPVENTSFNFTTVDILLNSEKLKPLSVFFNNNHSPPFQSSPFYISYHSFLC